jgi:hypothetical protein
LTCRAVQAVPRLAGGLVEEVESHGRGSGGILGGASSPLVFDQSTAAR